MSALKDTSSPALLWSKPISWKLFLGVSLAILIASAGLRLYQLGQVPSGMTWDEAAIGYNGYAVWDEFRDEWLMRLPVSFRSFGDYKAPFAMYMAGFFIKFFGSELWVLRLPFALVGVVGVAAMIWLTHELALLFKAKENTARYWSLLAGSILAFSPWHIHYSRAGFESGLALSWVMVGSAAFYRWLHTKHWFWGFCTVSFWIGSLYTYHSAKVFIPVLGAFLAIQHRNKILEMVRNQKWLVGYGLVASAPLLISTFFKSGAERANQTSILAADGNVIDKSFLLVSNFLKHVSPSFLVSGETTTLRHGDGVWGVLLPTTFALVVFGVVWYLKNRHVAADTSKKFFKYAAVWTAVGLLAPAIGLEVPHSNRALLALPGFIWLAMYGLDQLMLATTANQYNKVAKGSRGEKNLLAKTIFGGLMLVHGLLFASYWQHYLTDYRAESSEAFLDGYLEAVDVALEYENSVDEIVFSDKYGQPYIYVLFRKRVDPFEYRHYGFLNKFLFKGVEESDLLKLNTLVIASPDDVIPHDQADQVVHAADGSERFYIYYPN